MNLDIVSYEQALALKKLNFPIPEFSGPLCYYSVNKNIEWGEEITNDQTYAPTLELVAKWLRDEKDILIDICYTHSENICITKIEEQNNKLVSNNITKNINKYMYKLITYGCINNLKSIEYDTYEAALSSAIDKAIDHMNSRFLTLQLVTFEQAKDLEEIGFPQNITHEGFCYKPDGSLTQPIYTGEWCNISAPPLELVSKWLRDFKKTIIEITYNAFGELWELCITDYKGKLKYRGREYNSYEEALNTGIFISINHIKNGE